MKTLPDAIIAGMSGDSDRVILVRIIPESGDSWSELLWATKDITVTDWEGGGASKSFAGGVLKQGQLGRISQSVDIEEGGNVAKVSGLTFKIVNPEYNGTDRFDQNFAGNLENRTVELYLAFWTGSNPAWSDILLLHRFVVDDIDFDYGEYKIKVKDAGFKRHKNIPDLMINLDEYSEVSEKNKGCVIPLIYGYICDGTFGYGNVSFSPMYLINKNKRKFAVSRNKTYDAGTSNRVYLFFDKVNRFGQILTLGDSYDFTPTYGRPTTLEFPLESTLKVRLRSQCHGQGIKTDPSNANFVNITDDSEDTFWYLESNRKLYIKPIIPETFGKFIGGYSDLTLYIQCRDRIGNVITVKSYNMEDDAYETLGTIPIGSGYYLASFNLKNLGLPNDPLTKLGTTEFGIETDGSSYCKICNMYLYLENFLLEGEFFKHTRQLNQKSGKWETKIFSAGTVEYEDREKLYLNVKGEQYGTAIGDRSNGRFATAIAEHGAYIIELMLRSELELGDNEIEVDTFDAVGNSTDGDRKDWKFAGSVGRQESSLNVISEFCKQVGLIYFQNYENKESVVALKKRTAGKTIDRTTIQEGTIGVKFSDLNQVYNEFYLNYRKSSGDSFFKTLFITASDHNLSSNVRSGTPNTFTGLCADSQGKYLKTNRLTLDCDWIRDDATAELLIKWLAEWLCYRKYIVEFETAGLDHIDLELGDQVKIDHTLLPSGVSNNDSFLLFDISDDLNNDRMKFKFMQVPDLLP